MQKMRSALLSVLVLPLCLYAQKNEGWIVLNQLGYYVNGPKKAVLISDNDADRFFIISTISADTVFEGKLSDRRHSPYSSSVTRIADFSGLSHSGSFQVLIPGYRESYEFKINNGVYNDLAKASVKSYYYQRVSDPLEPGFAGKWSRAAGHPDTTIYIHPSAASAGRPAGSVISSPGGWYDAGDYNKYIVNSGITMGTLLSAYEDFHLYFDTLVLDIPESGDQVPDLLNEIIYNLRWMLTMQDPTDGGVYNKCTNAAFDGMVMPGVTRAPRYVVQKGTAAALDFTAVMAQASRILKNYNSAFPRLSDSCLKAAETAWQWALKHPDMEYNQQDMNKRFEPQISTGEYGDRNFADEWFWAASEMLVTTSEGMYVPAVLKHMESSMGIPSWSNVSMPGFYTLVRHENKLPDGVSEKMNSVKRRMIALADTMILKSKQNAFQTVMGQTVKDYIWGSNSVAANQGILLINVYRITKDQQYILQAISNLDYILGRNATGYCFITGFGTKSPRHPHHRPSVADNIIEPVPGFLAGGPNPGMQDQCEYACKEPETAYVDHDCSYASNEIAINWNAPFVYLVCALESLQKKIFVD